MDYFLEFSQKSSEISQDFFPPLELNPDSNYVLGLYSLTTYNSISNIKTNENDIISFVAAIDPIKLPSSAQVAKASTQDHILFMQQLVAPHIEEKEIIIQIPEGSYELAQLGSYISQRLKERGYEFSLTINTSTMKVEMSSNCDIKFPKNSIKDILGFQNNYYPRGYHVSEAIPQISAVNIVNVECNIIDGSFRNGKKSHSLYAFSPNVPTGYKLIERPSNILFLPVRQKDISNITLRLTNEKGKLVQFNHEEVTIHLVLREL